MIRVLFIAILTASIFSGCVSKPKIHPNTSFIKINLPKNIEESLISHDITLAINMPTGTAIKSSKITYIDSNNLRKNYAYHRWSNFLTLQIQEFFVHSIAKTNLVFDVAKAQNRIDPTLILEIDISEFAQYIDKNENSKVVVSGSMRFLNPKEKKALFSKTFIYEEKMENLGVNELSLAYDRVFALWLKDTLKIIDNLGESYAR